MFGFDEDRTSILVSPAVFAQYHAILAGTTCDGATARAGDVQPNFEFDRVDAGPPPLPVLHLRSARSC